MCDKAEAGRPDESNEVQGSGKKNKQSTPAQAPNPADNKELRRMIVAAHDEIVKWNSRHWGS